MQKYYIVLGGPGSGKSTLCKALVKLYNADHFSTGDILRNYCSQNDDNISSAIKVALTSGKLVDPSITLAFLEDFVNKSESSIVLIDGFPRCIETYNKIPDYIKDNSSIIYIEVCENVLKHRIKQRNENRMDDNDVTIENRLTVYKEETIPLIDLLSNQRMLVIDGSLPLTDNLVIISNFI